MRVIILSVCFFIINILPGVSFSDEKILSLQELSVKSTDIITGKVESKKCFYYNNDERRIYTSVRIRVEDTIKGSLKASDTVEILFYGGTLNGICTTVLGMPTYEVGEEILLFLRETSTEPFGRRYVVRGRSQGKFNILDGKVTRESPYPLMTQEEGEIMPITIFNSIALDVIKQMVRAYSM